MTRCLIKCEASRGRRRCNLSPGAVLICVACRLCVCVSVFIAICVAIFNLAHQLRQHAQPATCARPFNVCLRMCVCVCPGQRGRGDVSGRHVKSTRCVVEIKAVVCRTALFAFNAVDCLVLRVIRVVCATWDYPYDALSAQIMTAQFVTAAAQQCCCNLVHQSINLYQLPTPATCRMPHATCHLSAR